MGLDAFCSNFDRYAGPAVPFAFLGLECYALHLKEHQQNNLPLYFSKLFFVMDLISELNLFQTCALSAGYIVLSMCNQLVVRPPTYNTFKHNCHRLASGVDHLFTVSLKALYIFRTFRFFEQKAGFPTGVLAGMAMGMLSAYNIKRTWQVLPTPFEKK